MMLLIVTGGLYVAYSLNLLGPMMQMANAATNQAVEIGKDKLRQFIAENDRVRQAIGVPARQENGHYQNGGAVHLDRLDSRGKKVASQESDDDI
jgi:Root hair defective 3 GTP-binding protein (RHD3).